MVIISTLISFHSFLIKKIKRIKEGEEEERIQGRSRRKGNRRNNSKKNEEKRDKINI